MNQFHFEIDECVGLSKFVNFDDVWVVDGRQDFSLFPQTFYFWSFDIYFADNLSLEDNTLTAYIWLSALSSHS